MAILISAILAHEANFGQLRLSHKNSHRPMKGLFLTAPGGFLARAMLGSLMLETGNYPMAETESISS